MQLCGSLPIKEDVSSINAFPVDELDMNSSIFVMSNWLDSLKKRIIASRKRLFFGLNS